MIQFRYHGKEQERPLSGSQTTVLDNCLGRFVCKTKTHITNFHSPISTTPHWGSCDYSYQKHKYHAFLITHFSSETVEIVHPIIYLPETPDPLLGKSQLLRRKCKRLVCSDLLTEINPSLGKLTAMNQRFRGH